MKVTWYEQQVLLPFDLRGWDMDIYEGEVRYLLYQIFPKTNNFTEPLPERPPEPQSALLSQVYHTPLRYLRVPRL